MRKILFALLLGCCLVGATQIMVLKPVQSAVGSGDIVNLGVIGPGQKVEIVVDRASGFTKPEGGEALWDRALVEFDDAMGMAGWTREDSQFYERELRAYVSAARDAPNGEYLFDLKTIDEYEGAETTVVKCRVTVSDDVLDFVPGDSALTAGVGLPAVYYFVLKNKSSASDSFEVTVSGLPGGWQEARRFFVPYLSQRTITYSVSSQEAGVFPLVFKAESVSSELISKGVTGSLETKRDLYTDMLATSHGLLLFPSVQQAIYALFGLASGFK
ncbi:MAG: hypothetical protein WC607_04900 [Candidatus Micrarchaeia archaeon]